jgi:hypothetical protein
MEKVGGMTGVAVLVETVAIVGRFTEGYGFDFMGW